VKIEVLYVPDCPHHAPAVELLRSVLLAEGVRTQINEVAVTDAKTAQEYKFPGSPTIRINGRDIAGESHSRESFALACRMYGGTIQAGIPPIELMRSAVREALVREKT
jgi:hypothetical protein